MSDDIQEQLQFLKDEVRRMGRSIYKVREEDVRWAFCEQIRPILMEKVKKWFDSAAMDGMSGRTNPALESSLYDLIERFSIIFQRFGPEQAAATLEQGMAEVRSRFRPVEGDPADSIIIGLEEQMGEYLAISKALRADEKTGVVAEAIEPIAAATVEALLSPLSSAVRYELMVTLKEKERGLSELSRTLKLQKGHLQFHVKALLSSDYIGMDRTTRQYYLTQKGVTALKGIEGLIKDIQAA